MNPEVVRSRLPLNRLAIAALFVVGLAGCGSSSDKQPPRPLPGSQQQGSVFGAARPLSQIAQQQNANGGQITPPSALPPALQQPRQQPTGLDSVTATLRLAEYARALGTLPPPPLPAGKRYSESELGQMMQDIYDRAARQQVAAAPTPVPAPVTRSYAPVASAPAVSASSGPESVGVAGNSRFTFNPATGRFVPTEAKYAWLANLANRPLAEVQQALWADRNLPDAAKESYYQQIATARQQAGLE